MKNSILKFISTRRFFRRLAIYSILFFVCLLEFFIFLEGLNHVLQNRFSIYAIIVLQTVLFALLRKSKITLLFYSSVLLFIVSITTFHTAFLIGNGNGFSLENIMHLVSITTIMEFFKLSPFTYIAILMLIIFFTVIILGISFIIYWSFRPFPKNKMNIAILILFMLISSYTFFYFSHPIRDLKKILIFYVQSDKYKNCDKEFFLNLGIKTTMLDNHLIQATPGKNLILIILESTEQNYLNEKMFPQLLPNLKKFYQSCQKFKNISMAPNATITFGAMYSMFTGSILDHRHLLQGINSVHNPRIGARLSSFPKILHKAGYHQYFVVGHSGNVIGTESFVCSHKFDTVWFGIDRKKRLTISMAEQGINVPNFSLHDSEVYKQAWKFFEQASLEKKTFNITLLTMDAHGPNGIYNNKEPAYPLNAPYKYKNLFNAMYASDVALGQFLEKIANHPVGKDTVIVIVSDHLAHSYTCTSELLGKINDRRLLFGIKNSSKKSVSHNTPGKTFDIAPTILDALGVKHNFEFPLGESLYNIKHPQRLVETEEQLLALSYYTKLKSNMAENLPVDIIAKNKPYPHLSAGKIQIPVVFNKIADLPKENEFVVLPISSKLKIDAISMKYFKSFAQFLDGNKKEKAFIFLTNNTAEVAKYYKLPNQKGMVLGININNKNFIDVAPTFDQLFISKKNINKLLNKE